MSPFPLLSSTDCLTRMRSSKLPHFCSVSNSPGFYGCDQICLLKWRESAKEMRHHGRQCAQNGSRERGGGGVGGRLEEGQQGNSDRGPALGCGGRRNRPRMNTEPTTDLHPPPPGCLRYPAPAASGFVWCAPKPPLRTRNNRLPTAAPTPRPRNTHYIHSNVPYRAPASYLLHTARNAT